MKIAEIISKLSLDEKIALLTGRNSWETYEVKRLGIPSIRVSDGPHGLRREAIDDKGKVFTYESICFPTSSALAATWNTELVERIGEAIGEECQSNGVDIIMAPGTNIKRTPLCGRNFEYFSEDPYLAGELSAAYITGIQSNGIGTAIKHFAGNNQEYDRFNISSDIDIRALREIYLKPFELAIKKSAPWSVMCAYNRLNGIYCSENEFLLSKILKEEWGFDGFVISDWGAVHNKCNALKAGLDLEMPYSEKNNAQLKKDYEDGKINDEIIDMALENILKAIFKTVKNRKKRISKYNIEKHRALAKEAASEAVTLLKNVDGILPLDNNNIKSITVVGQLAEFPMIQGGGSSKVEPLNVTSPLESIRANAGDIKVKYCATIKNDIPIVHKLNETLEDVENSDVAVIFAGQQHLIETESYDRTEIRLEPVMEDIICKIAHRNPNTVVVIQAGSVIDMSYWINSVKSVVFAWFTGQEGGSALADILFGKSNPCGKTAETFPLTIEDTPSYGTYPGNGTASWYQEGIMVGYRYYDTFDREVLFPFGHGLSYSEFEYSDLRITPVEVNEHDGLEVYFKLKNTGKLKGKETAQVYLRQVAPYVLRPYKELKAFEKIELEPGETKEVKINMPPEAFAYYNININDWHIQGGSYQILVGASSRDIRLKGYIDMKTDYNFS